MSERPKNNPEQTSEISLETYHRDKDKRLFPSELNENEEQYLRFQYPASNPTNAAEVKGQILTINNGHEANEIRHIEVYFPSEDDSTVTILTVDGFFYIEGEDVVGYFVGSEGVGFDGELASIIEKSLVDTGSR